MMSNQSFYDTKTMPSKMDLVVSLESDFDITEDRVYVVQETNLVYVTVKNDAGKIEEYSPEYFRPYEGERLSTF